MPIPSPSRSCAHLEPTTRSTPCMRSAPAPHPQPHMFRGPLSSRKAHMAYPIPIHRRGLRPAPFRPSCARHLFTISVLAGHAWSTSRTHTRKRPTEVSWSQQAEANRRLRPGGRCTRTSLLRGLELGERVLVRRLHHPARVSRSAVQARRPRLTSRLVPNTADTVRRSIQLRPATLQYHMPSVCRVPASSGLSWPRVRRARRWAAGWG